MRVMNLSQEKQAAEFAECAARYFAANPTSYTYANGDPTAGELFAVRWNSYAVLVVRLADAEDVRVYPSADLIGGDIGRVKEGGTP